LWRELKEERGRKRAKKRKVAQNRHWTEFRKREKDRLRRKERKRLRRQGLKEPLNRTVRQRSQAIRYYRHWRERFTEQEAALRAAQKHRVSVGTIRRWDRLYRAGNLAALLPKRPGPTSAPFVIALEIQFLVVAIRRLLGWNEKRIAQEFAQRGLAQISHTAVGLIFKRYHLPTRTYHTLAHRDGIPKLRYEKEAPNRQWHIDFTETKLQDDTQVIIVALIDDYSRYCLCCEVVADLTTQTAIRIVEKSRRQFGQPSEIVSDNGKAFTSAFEGSPTEFGKLLQQKGIRHRLITPYWPEGNGKVEAFVKIVKHECLHHPFATIHELRLALADFVTFYNHLRLHGALGYQTPVSRFVGIQTVQNHGLAGIPGLPKRLLDAFPPSHPVHIYPVNERTVKQHFAIMTIGC
jgi:transposase InsO family protein